jgi:hypothetical protein
MLAPRHDGSARIERKLITDLPYWSVEHASGFTLILGVIAAFPGLMMFMVRGGQRGGAPRRVMLITWQNAPASWRVPA